MESSLKTKDKVMDIVYDNGGRRIGSERRKISCDGYHNDRRSGIDRRIGKDRRKKRYHQDIDNDNMFEDIT